MRYSQGVDVRHCSYAMSLAVVRVNTTLAYPFVRQLSSTSLSTSARIFTVYSREEEGTDSLPLMMAQLFLFFVLFCQLICRTIKLHSFCLCFRHSQIGWPWIRERKDRCLTSRKHFVTRALVSLSFALKTVRRVRNRV